MVTPRHLLVVSIFVCIYLALALSTVQADTESGQYAHPLLRNWYQNQKRVVGGNVAFPHSWPSLVGLWNDIYRQHFCGGSLLDQFWVVSAAHCFVIDRDRMILGNPSHISVQLGDHYLKLPEIGEYRRAVANFYVHPNYNYGRGTGEFDIALVKLAAPVIFTPTVQPILLPLAPPEVNRICFVAGWGQVHPEVRISPMALKQISMQIMDRLACNLLYTTNMFCAKNMYSHLGHGPCFGDSGGPLVCQIPGTIQWQLEGIVSHGSGPVLPFKTCNAQFKTAIFTNVFNMRAWIDGIRLHYG